MLIIQSIEIENYISFGPKQSFSFDSDGMHILRGINLDSIDDTDQYTSKDKYSVGSGKSSFMSAIEFCFWGDILERFKKKDNIVNKQFQMNCCVAVNLQKDNVRYRIERYRKHSKHKNNVRFLEWADDEWKDFTQTTNGATQEKINEILMYNQDLFHRSILLNRDNIPQFLSYNQMERGKLFESIMHADMLKSYFKKAKMLHDESEQVHRNLDNQKSALEIANKRLAKQIIDILDTKEKEISTLNSEIDALLENYKTLNNSDITTQNLVGYINTYTNKTNEYALFTKQTAITRTQLSKAELRKEKVVESLTKLDTRITNFKPQKCSACGVIQNEEEYNETLKEWIDNKKHLDDELQELTEEVNTLTEQIVEINENDIKYQGEINALLDIIPDEITELLDDKDNIDNLIRELTDIEDVLKQKRDKIALIQNSNVDENLRVSVKANLKQIKQYKKDIETCEAQMEVYDFWMQVLDIYNENSVKQHLMSIVVPVFNKFVQDNLDHIYNGLLTITFDQSLNETIIYGNQVYEYSEFSTGEQIKLNLGINLAMFDMIRFNLTDTNVIFMDEIFTNVDEPTTKMFLKFIEDKYSKTSAVYIVSHQPYVIENLDPKSILSIVKENNFSRIQQGDL